MAFSLRVILVSFFVGCVCDPYKRKNGAVAVAASVGQFISGNARRG
jgi:hypothetical protein